VSLDDDDGDGDGDAPKPAGDETLDEGASNDDVPKPVLLAPNDVDDDDANALLEPNYPTNTII
jgi:hypothetical protein